jgi:transposase
MGQSFIACDREQSFLLPPDVREWLPEDHLGWFVIDAVATMDLDVFYAAYRADGRSRPAYEPSMMVALLLYAYARGIRSSRVIERACVEDVAFRVIAAQRQPDHATIARFIERHQDAIGGLFGEVLTLCARNGLASVGVIAVDGTKVMANASRNENLDYEQIAREISRKRSRPTPPRTRSSARPAATNCLRNCARPVGAGPGCAKPRAGSRPSATPTPSRCRAIARSD